AASAARDIPSSLILHDRPRCDLARSATVEVDPSLDRGIRIRVGSAVGAADRHTTISGLLSNRNLSCHGSRGRRTTPVNDELLGFAARSCMCGKYLGFTTQNIRDRANRGLRSDQQNEPPNSLLFIRAPMP